MKLLEFPHSHFCEKARWALDFKGIPFQAVAILPGLHLLTVRRYAPGTSVPVLLAGTQAIQGSSEIIDFLEQHHPAHSLTPLEEKDRQHCLDFENEMESELGKPIRQVFYHRLLAYPAFIRFCFTHPLSPLKQFIFRLYYPALQKKIYQVYVVSDNAVTQAKSDFDYAMDMLAQLLEKKTYLFSDRFSRADLTVSSLLCFLVMPPQHPFPWPKIPDSEIRSIQDSYKDHPVCIWVKRMYELHRLGQESSSPVNCCR